MRSSTVPLSEARKLLESSNAYDGLVTRKRFGTPLRSNRFADAPPVAPFWMCPCCGRSVGLIGNWLAKLFGVGIHGCDFSRWTEARLEASAANDR